MTRLLLLLLFLSPGALAESDFMCGLYHVTINDLAQLRVNDKNYGDYRTSVLDRNNSYIHQFGNSAELRVTQKNRVAFRIKGDSPWNACVPLVFYGDRKHD